MFGRKKGDELKDQNQVWNKIFPNGIDMDHAPRFLSRVCPLCHKHMERAFISNKNRLICTDCAHNSGGECIVSK